MTFIDTNLTFSKQVCDLAVGSIMGAGAVIITLGKLLYLGLWSYAIYRITQIFIQRSKR